MEILWTPSGYEPKWFPKLPEESKMMQRRRATTKELEHGEKEKKESQKRLEKEMKESGELQIEDGGKQEENRLKASSPPRPP